MKSTRQLTCCVALSLASSTAFASTTLIQVPAVSAPTSAFHLYIANSPKPISSTATSFTVKASVCDVGGALPAACSPDVITFYTGAGGGGFSRKGGYFASNGGEHFTGPALFCGPTSSPILMVGTFKETSKFVPKAVPVELLRRGLASPGDRHCRGRFTVKP